MSLDEVVPPYQDVVTKMGLFLLLLDPCASQFSQICTYMAAQDCNSVDTGAGYMNGNHLHKKI